MTNLRGRFTMRSTGGTVQALTLLDVPSPPAQASARRRPSIPRMDLETQEAAPGRRSGSSLTTLTSRCPFILLALYILNEYLLKKIFKHCGLRSRPSPLTAIWNAKSYKNARVWSLPNCLSRWALPHQLRKVCAHQHILAYLIPSRSSQPLNCEVAVAGGEGAARP